MEGENNIATVKIDIHGKIRCTVQDGERECLLEVKSEAESWIDQVKRRHKHESKEYKKRKTSPGVSIYRVPESIKITKREAYDPLVVFLGPYHHKKHQQLTAVDEYKLQAVDRTLERLPGMTIEGLVAKVAELEKEIRVCYEDSASEWDGDTLAWIMTMDACFILEFLLMDLPNSSLVFHSQREFNIKRREIILDIMKLENQIPFCILKKILELNNDPVAVPAFLAEKLCKMGPYFHGFPFIVKKEKNDKVISRLPGLIERGPYHLLDLSRQLIADFLSNSGSGSAIPDKSCGCNVLCGVCSCIATPNRVACFRGANWMTVFRSLLRSSAKGSMIPSAEKLQKAGIELKASTEAKFHFKRRCFQGSTLFVPQITVEDDTEIFLRNLVAFEECQMHTHSPIKRVISSYMWIMDQLIDSKEDVKLFQKADIIKNYLGTEDRVAQIFNDLSIGVSVEAAFRDVLEMVNDRYKSQLNVWISEFKEQHCSRPWYIVSLLVAILLLVMTLLQTIYTMKGYFQSS